MPRKGHTQHVAQHPETLLRNTPLRERNTDSPPKGGGGESVASRRLARKEENRLLLKEWFAQKRELPDVAGMAHVGTVLRRILEKESA